MPEPEMTATEQAACEEAMKRIGECVRRRGTVLDLSQLNLTRLPPKILQLAKLTELDLSHNLLAELPAELCQLPGLARLDLSNNPLGILSAEIGQLANLTGLDLSHTLLVGLPSEIGRLANLTRMEISHTPLAALPPEIGQLAKLTRLYLTDTPLTALPAELGQLGSLTRLYLANNRLASLPPELGQLANLTRLDLSNNRLGALPPELGRLAKLTVLDLSNNLLESLPAELGQLAKLTVLSLTANRLAGLSERLRELENLESLLLHDNPDLQLAPSVLGADPRKAESQPGSALRPASAKSILEFYFARLTGKTRPLNEVKLMVVGRSGAGKTTMLQALRELPFRDREESTPGIALGEWPLDGGQGEPVTVHGWDFSGQEFMRSLHPFFFSRRSLYVVVLTGRDHHEREDAEYWLGLIETFGTDELGQPPPVIVALNQWNVPGCRPEMDRGALRERFPFIRGFVEMDCKVKKGIPVLKAALNRELERMPWVREPFPEEWHAVRRALAAAKTVLTEAEYRALCVAHGVPDQGQQDYLAEAMHHLGTALRFPHDPLLQEAAVWQPEWLTRHAYALLHRAEKLSGILRQTEVALTLYAEPDETLRAYLMRFLEHCGVARPLQTKAGESWLVPLALPQTPPTGLDEFHDAAGASRLRYRYQAMPEGLVERVCQRRFDHIEELKEQKQLWHGGLVLARKGARALIREVPHDRQVQVTVIGPHATRLELADLCRAELREIHAEIPGLEPVEESRRKGEWVPPKESNRTGQDA